jgi:hypothetical protein
VLLARGKAGWAAACFRDALRREPRHAAAAMDLGDALFAGGHHAEAEKAYEQGLALDPSAAVARESTQAAWRTIRLERARGELPTTIRTGFLTAATARAFDAWHRLEPLFDWLGTPGRRAASVGVLLLIALLCRVGFVVLPHYVAHYRLHDEVVRLSRAPTRDDAVVREQVLDAVRRLGRGPFVRAADVEVESASGMRRVGFGYDVEVTPFPGVRAPLRFAIRVEEPYFVEPNPIVF